MGGARRMPPSDRCGRVGAESRGRVGNEAYRCRQIWFTAATGLRRKAVFQHIDADHPLARREQHDVSLVGAAGSVA